MAELVTELLKLAFPEEQIACVSSQSADRVKDIDAFRQGKKGILVTTTILERVLLSQAWMSLCLWHSIEDTVLKAWFKSQVVWGDLSKGQQGRCISFTMGLAKQCAMQEKKLKK